MSLDAIGGVISIVFLAYIGFGAYIRMKMQDKKYNIYNSK